MLVPVESNVRKRLALCGQFDAGQPQMRSATGKVLQRPALQVNQRPFPGRVHYFQHELEVILCREMKVVVVLPGQWPRAYLQPVKIAGESNRHVWGNWLRNRQCRHHFALTNDCWIASKPEQDIVPSCRPSVLDQQHFRLRGC